MRDLFHVAWCPIAEMPKVKQKKNKGRITHVEKETKKLKLTSINPGETLHIHEEVSINNFWKITIQGMWPSICRWDVQSKLLAG